MDDNKFWLCFWMLAVLALAVAGAIGIGGAWVQSKNQQPIDPIAQRIMKIGESGIFSSDKARLVELALKGSTNTEVILESK